MNQAKNQAELVRIQQVIPLFTEIHEQDTLNEVYQF